MDASHRAAGGTVTLLAVVAVVLAVSMTRRAAGRRLDRLIPVAASPAARWPAAPVAGPATASVAAVPLVCDVIGGCLDAGATVADAVRAGAGVAGPALAQALRDAAERLAYGDDPTQVWAALAARRPEARELAVACARGSRSGVAIGSDLRRLAARSRRGLQAQRQRRVQRAGVWVVLPLGLCFLPAFVLVAVVPLALGALTASPTGVGR